jgi:hypothetical protein
LKSAQNNKTMKQIINAIDRSRYLLAALVFLVTLLILNSCAPLPIRRDPVQEAAPLPVWTVRNLNPESLQIPR